MHWYVTRDGNAIIGTSGAPLGAGTSWDAKLVGVAAATAALDTPAAGSRTYKMFARAENTSATTAVVFQRILTIAEYKRCFGSTSSTERPASSSAASISVPPFPHIGRASFR